MNKQDLVTTRNAVPEDYNFILATWLRALFYGGSIYSEMQKDDFMHSYHSVIENYLASPNTSVKVACLKEDPNVILGYSVLIPAIKGVHFTFVKKSWRGIGIARDLVPADTAIYTQFTKAGLAIAKKKGIKFNPFII